jgi:CBS domain-containing protein
MPLIDHHQVLKGLTVQEAMRRQVIQLPAAALLSQAIRTMIKYKVNAILVTGQAQDALGVVSKTDLMTAYYGGLPLETPVAEIMVGPPQFCQPKDSLDAALDQMREYQIHRLYVTSGEVETVTGVLAFPDIVGMLYRYCHRCDRSLLQRREKNDEPQWRDQFHVREVMTSSVVFFSESDSLWEVMGGLAAYKFGAVPIIDATGHPVGVVSKSDLVMAYLHGVSPETEAREVMSAPILSCDQEELLLTIIKQMIYSDLHRIFVYKEQPQSLVGMLSLSDAARFRSGSCRACLVSRIKI